MIVDTGGISRWKSWFTVRGEYLPTFRVPRISAPPVNRHAYSPPTLSLANRRTLQPQDTELFAELFELYAEAGAMQQRA